MMGHEVEDSGIRGWMKKFKGLLGLDKPDGRYYRCAGVPHWFKDSLVARGQM